ncbi:uncharacterized protein MELLADRAFT_107919 [Melampsora larici-populina 98AG31]|uniref:ATP-dependent RNA helicase n=1 Tax=Melampsora larici-populina (strain 98AG31 / pathotype 3-4-7) TaxID=747676 RepID=F4RRD8_MELLP|nr:uncharacterized protein MELLADRAFT_107919 [Melampsora larici-populina 98AG31]EGG04920.1 hypothetical protein MELLADRAFT_107919 [Melampsora larici-populina 98AG31]
MNPNVLHQFAMGAHHDVKERPVSLLSRPNRASTASSGGDDDDLSTSSNSNSNFQSQLSIDDRLSRLESSIGTLGLMYQRDMNELRTQLDCLMNKPKDSPPFSAINSSHLNKNATPFVPLTSTYLNTNTTNHHENDEKNENAKNPGAVNQPFNSLSQTEQIHSLSQQVNLLSQTMSQLLSTLITSPSANTPSTGLNLPPQLLPIQNLNVPKLRPAVSQTLPQIPAQIPNPPIQRSLSINSFSSPPNRAHPGHPPHLNFNSPSNDYIQKRLYDATSLPSPQLVLSPVNSQHEPYPPRNMLTISNTLGPNASASVPPSPMSPAAFDQYHSGGSAPANSLAGKWEQLGITGDVLRAIVRFGIGPPTKTQQKSIPLMLVGKDLVSQSNPIQERIQAYVIPALQLISHSARGPSSGAYPAHFQLNKPAAPPAPNQTVKVLIITATLDEASQAYRLANGIASLLPYALKVSHCSSDAQPPPSHPAVSMHPQPHILIGTPSKLLDPVNGLRGYNFDASDFISVVLDEMDQLLARNMTDMVTSLMNFLPTNQVTSSPDRLSPPLLPKSSTGADCPTPAFDNAHRPPGSQYSVTSPIGPSFKSAPSPLTPGFPTTPQDPPRGRQTCIFSCTVPQDVLSYARTLNLRARVLVRRDEPASNNSATHQSNNGPAGSYEVSDLRGQLPNSLPSLSGRISPQELVKSLRQYYVSIQMGGGVTGRRGREWKLDALVELLLDLDHPPEAAGGEHGQPFVLVYCNSVDSVECVSQKLISQGIDALALHQDMGPAARHSILTRFNKAPLGNGFGNQKGPKMKALVVYDVLSKSLVDLQSYQSILPVARQTILVNFELPRAVEDYVHRAACMISNHKRPIGSGGVLINFVSVLSDVEMVRSIESFYRCQINELPHHHLHLL